MRAEGGGQREGGEGGWRGDKEKKEKKKKSRIVAQMRFWPDSL